MKKEKLNDANDVNSHMKKMSDAHGVLAYYDISVMMCIVDVVTDDLIVTLLIISNFFIFLCILIKYLFLGKNRNVQNCMFNATNTKKISMTLCH